MKSTARDQLSSEKHWLGYQCQQCWGMCSWSIIRSLLFGLLLLDCLLRFPHAFLTVLTRWSWKQLGKTEFFFRNVVTSEYIRVLHGRVWNKQCRIWRARCCTWNRPFDCPASVHSTWSWYPPLRVNRGIKRRYLSVCHAQGFLIGWESPGP